MGVKGFGVQCRLGSGVFRVWGLVLGVCFLVFRFSGP